jgi:hypothetical protein
MADYYILKNDKRLSDAIDIKGAHRVINIDHIKTNSLQFIDSNPIMFHIEDKGLYPDFIEQPLPLISNKFKTVFDKMKLKNIFFKPVFLTDVKKMDSHLYWLIIPEKINCLSNATEFNNNGSLKTLRINKEKVGYYKVFKVNSILEDLIILHEDIVKVADTDIYGCMFSKI